MTTSVPTAGPPRVRRSDLIIVAVLTAVAVLCWIVTVHRMAGMSNGPTTELGSLGFYTTVWVVMMAAMMFPSVWPIIAIYERVRSRRADVPASGTLLVIGGYLAAWTAAGLAAFGLIALGRSLFGNFLPWGGAGRWAAAGIVFAAAVYEVTPLKNACLARCRGPFDFVTTNWRPGRAGALRIGTLHGLWCLGCCWGLMAALLALGVMSVGWMAAIGGMIAWQKLLPWRSIANYGVAAALAVVAAGLIVAPASVPGMPAGTAAATPMHMSTGMR